MRLLVALAVVAAAIPLATAGAATTSPYPKCWKGQAGCKHSVTPSWELETFNGSVTTTHDRAATLTCADAASGPKQEVISGTYSVAFTLNPKDSKQVVRSDAKGQPETPFALNLRFNVSRVTHEKIHTVTPDASAAGGCTDATTDCNKTGDPLTKPDKLSISTSNKVVTQNLAGRFVEDAFVPCAPDTASPNSLLPAGGGMFGTFMSELTGLRFFNHRTTLVVTGRTDRPGEGEVTSTVSGRLSYRRSLRRCTYYAHTGKRCVTARG